MGSVPVADAELWELSSHINGFRGRRIACKSSVRKYGHHGWCFWTLLVAGVKGILPVTQAGLMKNQIYVLNKMTIDSSSYLYDYL